MKKWVILTSVLLTGCMNMPTPPNQITGTYVSDETYASLDCARLSVEAETLSRREHELAAAQTQRVKTSQMQAFWWGFGQGDSIEANELADIRGHQEALKKTQALKSCSMRQ